MVEQMNRTIGQHLVKVVSDIQHGWDRHLSLCLLAYRSSVHQTIKQNPVYVLFWRELYLLYNLKFGIKPKEELSVK